MQLDTNGWLDIQELIKNANRSGIQITLELLHEVVATNDKRRFMLSEDGLRIRANQGHSVPDVDLNLLPTSPPGILYHGTVSQFLSSIRKRGLLKRSRNHVHLSADSETAKQVGSRRGAPVVLVVDSHGMHANGHQFFLSVNKVWLVESVPVKFLTFPEDQ